MFGRQGLMGSMPPCSRLDRRAASSGYTPYAGGSKLQKESRRGLAQPHVDGCIYPTRDNGYRRVDADQFFEREPPVPMLRSEARVIEALPHR